VGKKVCVNTSGEKNKVFVSVKSVVDEALYGLTTDERNAKVEDPQQMIAAIRALIRKEQTVPLSAEQPSASVDDDGPAKVLTSREQQVMELLAKGNTNREIAQLLEVSIKTVDTHRGHVMKKLKIRNNSELTRFAIKHNYVSL
jgi:DNA-binding NarL/FixJ family response regulator